MENKELYNAMQKGGLYDYVSNHGYQLSKDDLISIIKELSYVTYCDMGCDSYNDFERKVCNSLKDNTEIFND